MEGHAKKKGTTQASPAKPAATGAKNDTAAVPDERAILAKVHKLEKSVTEKAQLDNIPELLRTCTDAASTATVTFNTVRVLQRVFMHLAAKEVLDLGASEDKKEANKQQPLKAAALSHYKAFVRTLIALLLHRHDQVKTLALKVLMEFLHKKTIAFNAANKENSFPLKHFAVVIERLVSESNGKETGLFSQFVGKYLSKYDDIRYYTLKSLRILCEQKKSAAEQSPANDTVLAMYLLLQKVTMPESDQHITSFWIPVQTKSLKALSAPAVKPKKKKNKKSKLNEYERMEQKKQKKRTQTKIASKKSDGSLAVKFAIGHRKIFEACWLAFLALPLTTPIYKDILRRMDTHILPYMVQPIRLIDFLKDSYDVGGVVSLLALHGLFILITKHNLDYPDFYRKLYALFQPNIFHVKYRAKFFRLVNIFLKSSHLPSYLIAAFVKRMARMALHAPPSGALFVIAFVYNMLKRHPQIQIMLHHADDLTTGGSLLPVDTRKPTGVKKNEEAVLMLAPSGEAAAAPANDSVFMLDSNSSNGAGADGNNKRKRDDEEEAIESAETKEEENQTAANGSAAPVEAQGKKKRRRRGRGGAKPNGEEEGMDGVEETDAQPPAEEEKNSGKKNVSTGPIEENENELARYTHSGAQGSDPFSFEELDPQKCKALSSSLWELKTLQHHYVPQVSKLAKIFDEPPVKQAFDLEDFIELSYLSLFEAHVKRKTKSPTALAYQPQETLFSVSDSFQADWTFA